VIPCPLKLVVICLLCCVLLLLSWLLSNFFCVVEFAILYPGEGVVVPKLRVDIILWILKVRVNDLLWVA